jgi:hypothetical protein
VLSAGCAISIGDPPSDSSFQIRGHTVILYLPKYCILDKKIVALNRGVPDKGRPSGDRYSE